MDEIQLNHLKGAVEALLFVSEKPVSIDQFKDAIPGSVPADLKEAVKALEADYTAAGKGIVIAEIAHGYQMLSNQLYAGYIREFYKTRHKEKLSRPALESLAIIAYKQPVSRTDVELIRGINSDGVVMHLLNKGLIKIAGRKEVPGRPYVYGTTTQFLEYFGLRSLEDLPRLEEFPALMAKANEVAATLNPDVSAVSTVDLPAEALPEAAPEVPLVIPEAEAETRLDEELAKVRTKLDIEQIEKEAQSLPDVEPGQGGEASGQSRLMGDNGDDGHGSDTPAQ
ncbi:MAG: SMC-Scp complex subunit ScpB [Candidatus Omnitrophica bacterium]|nr:SMC-Scp complex subunit ScpB [Candidatus Omnitrophota bacterium]